MCARLTAIGYLIDVIFEQDNLWFVVALLAAMVLFGAFTARSRARRVPNAFWPLLLALTLASATTLGSSSSWGCSTPRPATWCRYEIEATLALGATRAQAIMPVVRRSLRSGMIPLIDSTKTTGLIFFPGTMVGMLLAGAAPVDAVRLQLVLLYVLLGSVAIGALTSALLAYRNFFTPAHQLRDQPA